MKRILMVTIISSVMAAAPVMAKAESTTSTSTAQKQTAEEMNISVKGFNGMRDIQLARMALFQGHTENATKLVEDASVLLSDDSEEWKNFATSTKNSRVKNDQFIVVNASVGVNEKYISTPEKEESIKKANEKIAQGDKKGAVHELRIAGVDVYENIYLMPLKQTQKNVTEAKKLLDEKKYYEANLVLKNAEDSIVLVQEAAIADK